MPRGKRDIFKTRRILKKVLDGVPFKQIAFEEDTTEAKVSFLKTRYIRAEVELTLNKKGVKLMNEEQFYLKF